MRAAANHCWVEFDVADFYVGCRLLRRLNAFLLHIPGVPRCALHPRLYAGARIRGLKYAPTFVKNVGNDRFGCVPHMQMQTGLILYTEETNKIIRASDKVPDTGRPAVSRRVMV